MNSTERENYEYLKARVVNLESDLRAARTGKPVTYTHNNAVRGAAEPRTLHGLVRPSGVSE